MLACNEKLHIFTKIGKIYTFKFTLGRIPREFPVSSLEIDAT